MATITSAQSGYWDDPMTWVGETVPDLSVDDVVVADYHTVTAAGSYLTLSNGRNITVEANGVLEIGTQLTVESGASVYVQGRLHIEDYAQVHVYGEMDIDSGGGVEVNYYGEHYVENGGMLTVEGYVQLSYYSLLIVSYVGKLIVGRLGSVDAYYESSIYFDDYSRSDIFGHFGLAEDSYLSIGHESLVRVYRDISVSGRMVSDGGKIVMMRREGRINDADGDSLFVFDQAYGHGLTMIT